MMPTNPSNFNLESLVNLGISVRVLDASEIDEVLTYEQARSGADNPEAVIQNWNAPWRKESLEHYVPKGWCFSLRNKNEKLVGYFLAQPLLFYNGLTQVLWVEYLSFDDQNLIGPLIDLARKCARDKHLQKVIFHSKVDLSPYGATRCDSNAFEFTTTRMT